MRNRFPHLVLVLCAAGFAFGLFRLFVVRYQAGDVYPAYSSLRADPLGTMAFYESLGRLPGMTVVRDFSAQNRLPPGREVAYLHLAASPEDWTTIPEEVGQALDGFLAQGGRLVLTFMPQTARPFSLTPTPATPPRKPPKKSSAEEERLRRRTSLKLKWGVEFAYSKLETDETDSLQPATVTREADLPLPETLPWHSGLTLTNLTGVWRTIYARGTNAVVAERKFGPGTVVLATDSYFLSNESLTKDRHADLLGWLVGPARRVVFDEAHFGIVDTSGVARLMRQYRLHGLAAGLLLLALLFVWKNSVSFLPAYPDENRGERVRGKETAEGFVNLLRRNIPSRQVLRLCFDEWTRTLQRRSGYSIARVDRAQAVLEEEAARAKAERDPVKAYQEICHVLKGK